MMLQKLKDLHFSGLLMAICCLTIFPQASSEPYIYKSMIGFADRDERIIGYKLSDADSKITIVGKHVTEFWEVNPARLLRTVPHQLPKLDHFDTSLVIDPSGTKAVTVDSFTFRMLRRSRNVSASVWDLMTGKQIAVLQRPNEPIRHAEWTADGSMLITLSGFYNLKRTEICSWDGESLSLLACRTIPDEYDSHVLVDKGDRLLLFTTKTSSNYWIGTTHSLILLNTRSLKTEFDFNSAVKDLKIYSLWRSYSLDRMALLGISKQKLLFWNIGDTSPHEELKPFNDVEDGYSFGFVENSHYFYAKQGKLLRVFDQETGKMVAELSGLQNSDHEGDSNIGRVILTPDGSSLVIKSCAKAEFFDFPSGMRSGEIGLVCKSEFDLVSSSYRDWDTLSIDRGGKLLMTSSDQTVRIWSLGNRSLVQTLVNPDHLVLRRKDPKKDDGLAGASWIMDGKFILARGADKRSLLLWQRN